MVIAAHISGRNSKNSRLLTCLQAMAIKNTDDNFIFFTEDLISGFHFNCTRKEITPKPKNKLLLYYWYNYKLPAILKKYNAGAFISDADILSFKTGVPQYLYLDAEKPEKGSNSYFKRIYRLSLAKAKHIFTAEKFFEEELIRKYAADPQKILSVYYGLPEIKEETNTAQQTEIKERYTEGCDYFLYPVSNSSSAPLISLLKAFSQLKNRQKTSLKLLLLLQKNVPEEDLIPDLKNYKYRADIIICRNEISISERLVRTCFALIWLAGYEDVNISFNALQCGVPVIASDNAINKSHFGSAVLFTDASEKDLTEKMQMLYKDEHFRKELVRTGNFLLRKYNANAAAEKMQSVMLQL